MYPSCESRVNLLRGKGSSSSDTNIEGAALFHFCDPSNLCHLLLGQSGEIVWCEPSLLTSNADVLCQGAVLRATLIHLERYAVARARLKLARVPIRIYSASFLFSLSLISPNLNTDFAAIMNPMADISPAHTNVTIRNLSSYPMYFPAFFRPSSISTSDS